MFTKPEHEEINHRTIKFIIGAIALTLAGLTGFFADDRLTSISASYWEFNPVWYLGWSQTIFIGFLFAIAGFLLCYNRPVAEVSHPGRLSGSKRGDSPVTAR